MRVPPALLGVCPKCQRERKPTEQACARCGLRVDLWEGFRVELPSSPPVDEAWERLKADWHSDDAHRRFLEQAASFDGLDVAAALYREAWRQARRESSDDPRAQEGLRRAGALAESLYAQKAHAARTRVPSGWIRVAGFLGAIVIILGGLGAAWLLMRH